MYVRTDEASRLAPAQDMTFGRPAAADRTTAPAPLALTRVPNTRLEPFRWICRILTRSYDKPGVSIGTGILISPYHVLTCAHVIYPPQATRTKEINVFPGQNGPDDEDWPSFRANGWAISPGWRANNCHTAGEDFGIVRLARSTNFGFWRLGPFDPAQLAGVSATLAGYPASKEEKARFMFLSRAPIVAGIHISNCTEPTPQRKGTLTGVLAPITETTKLIAHGLDTAPSQSGGPMWILREGQRVLVALHAGDIADGAYKKGVLLSTGVRRRVAGWISNSMRPIRTAAAA
jgi:V8-like Glu-specific endopeptidase